VPGPTQEFQFSAAPGAWRPIRAEPADDLRGLVLEYWEVEGALSAFRETLLPNGAVEVMINLGPPHRVLSATGQGVWERAWFSGLHEHSIIIESLAGTHLLSARLHALGAVALLGRRVAESVNRIVDLDTFIESGGDALRERALSATTVTRLQQSTSVSWSVLASEAGYSDQSHLARDFRRVGAASPTEYLQRQAPGAPGANALLYDAE